MWVSVYVYIVEITYSICFLLCICSGECIFTGVTSEISSLKGETVEVSYWPTYNGKIRQNIIVIKKGTAPPVAWIPFRFTGAKGHLSAGTHILISVGFTVKAVALCPQDQAA